jgi:hypothetical protein
MRRQNRCSAEGRGAQGSMLGYPYRWSISPHQPTPRLCF